MNMLKELPNTKDLHYEYFCNHQFFFKLQCFQYNKYQFACNFLCLFSNLSHQNQ